MNRVVSGSRELEDKLPEGDIGGFFRERVVRWSPRSICFEISYPASPYCFIFRQSDTVLIPNASATRRR
jgi:hypothetical protein